MTTAGILLLILLSGAIVFFITEWLRADLVALLLLVALGVTGILTPQETLSGFSRSAVITIMAIYILTAGLARTGATRVLGARLMQLGGQGELRLSVVLMSAGAVLSLLMNNIAAAAVLLPATMGIARERKISPSKLLMPLAFGTLLGGMATLLTTSNILVSAALPDAQRVVYEAMPPWLAVAVHSVISELSSTCVAPMTATRCPFTTTLCGAKASSSFPPIPTMATGDVRLAATESKSPIGP